jgi:hypothetical protein
MAALSLPAWQMRHILSKRNQKQMTSLRPDYSLDKKERMRHAGVGINRQMAFLGRAANNEKISTRSPLSQVQLV